MAETELVRFLAHVKYEDGNYVLQDWPIAQTLHDAETLASALLAAGYAKRSDTIEECAKVADERDENGSACPDENYRRGYRECAKSIANSIRNLKDKP